MSCSVCRWLVTFGLSATALVRLRHQVALTPSLQSSTNQRAAARSAMPLHTLCESCSDQVIRWKSSLYGHRRVRPRPLCQPWHGREGISDHRSRHRASARVRLRRDVERRCTTCDASIERGRFWGAFSPGERSTGALGRGKPRRRLAALLNRLTSAVDVAEVAEAAE